MSNLLRQVPRHLQQTRANSTPILAAESARAYCAHLLSTHDQASSLLTTFHPPSTRDAHLALRAFNLEIALIDTSTRTPALATLRLQFWRDTINKLFKPNTPPPAEPIATLLHHCIHSLGAPLSKSFLLKLLATRERYLGDKPFATLDELESYAEGTYGSLQYLALEAAHVQEAKLDHVGSHIGKACGIVAVLRGVHIGVKRGQGSVVLPIQVCAEAGLRQEEVLRKGPDAKGLKDAVFTVATRANDHLITARKMFGETGEQGKQVGAFSTFLHAVPASAFLERLEKADFDPFAPVLHRKEWKLPWRSYRAFSKREF